MNLLRKSTSNLLFILPLLVFVYPKNSVDNKKIIVQFLEKNPEVFIKQWQETDKHHLILQGKKVQLENLTIPGGITSKGLYYEYTANWRDHV